MYGTVLFLEVSGMPAFRTARNQTKNNISPIILYFAKEVLNIINSDISAKKKYTRDWIQGQSKGQKVNVFKLAPM